MDTAKNAGNIAKQMISFNGLATPFVQTYKYDSLDRIAEAKETSGTTQTWIQNFGYDRFGNCYSFYQNVSENVLAIGNKTLSQIEQSMNRIKVYAVRVNVFV